MSLYPRPASCIFLGTGGSTGIPNLSCLTSLKEECAVCPSALTKEGARNYRRNTSVAISVEVAPGEFSTLMIDCGKTFNHGAIAFFPHFGIRKIDALLLTHDHADACFGLDDLRFNLHDFTNSRSLTLRDISEPIQSHIPIHVSLATYNEVTRMFPYLKDARQSSGSGAVAALTWYTFRESSSFFLPSCGNLEVIPLPVEHGRRKLAGGDSGAYICMGFRMGDFSYISDASSVPEDTRRKIQGTRVLVLDALRERPHLSHMNFQEAKEFVKSIVPPPEITYFTGFSHDTDHYWIEKDLRTWSACEGIDVVPAFDGLKVDLLQLEPVKIGVHLKNIKPPTPAVSLHKSRGGLSETKYSTSHMSNWKGMNERRLGYD